MGLTSDFPQSAAAKANGRVLCQARAGTLLLVRSGKQGFSCAAGGKERQVVAHLRVLAKNVEFRKITRRNQLHGQLEFGGELLNGMLMRGSYFGYGQ